MSWLKRVGDQLAAEGQRVGALLLVGDVALQRLDADRLVDHLAPARHLAEPDAHPPAGRRHRVFLQDDAERMLRLAVADEVDVARHVDARGTGLDARRGHVGQAVRLGPRAALDLALHHVAEMAQRRQQRLGAGLAEAAHRGRGHLLGQRLQLVEAEPGLAASAQRVERVAHQHRAHPARRAFAATLRGGFRHQPPQRVDEADIAVEDEEAAVAEEGADAVVVIEHVEIGERRRNGALLGRGCARTVVVDDAVPNAIGNLGHAVLAR